MNKNNAVYRFVKYNQLKRESGKLPVVEFDSRFVPASNSFLNKNKKYKKLAVVGCYFSDGLIAEHFLKYLTALNAIFDGVVLIGDCPVLESELFKLDGKVIHYSFDRHGEYDFGSYKRGYNFLIEQGLVDNLDQLLFTNDSCFGPFTDLKNIFKTMESRKVDFWGLILNQELQIHIQSWFLVINKTVLQSHCLEKFFERVKKEEYQWDVVFNSELAFTQYLSKRGFKYSTYVSYEQLVKSYGYYANPMLYSYILVSRYKFPFIKIKTFTDFVHLCDQRLKTMEYIHKNYKSWYPLIVNYLMYKNMDTTFLEAARKADVKRLTYKEIVKENYILRARNKFLEEENALMKNSKKWKIGSAIADLYHLSFFRINEPGKKQLMKEMLPYKSEYQDNEDFSKYSTQIKTLAFYLPQYHEFEENNRWWGKGFTEWVNAKKSKPRFKDHYQPRLPHDDIGFYDLSHVETLKKQAALAKQHGVSGFIFYYYWFSGKKLMDLPINLLLSHPEIDLPFCLCWANENWSRRWDGQNKNVLIAQNYNEDDPEKFIRDIKKYMDDPRYIRINNKPVIFLYNPYEIPNVDNVIKRWKKEAIKLGIGKIYVVCRNLMFSNKLSLSNSDAEFDFPPVNHAVPEARLHDTKEYYAIDYYKTVDRMCTEIEYCVHEKPYFYTSTMGWDNTSRRKYNCFVFYHFDLEKFYDWTHAIVKHLLKKPKEERILLINAWNEWCEGTYLEPDKKYGYANINTLSKAIYDIEFNESLSFTNKTLYVPDIKPSIAIQAHIFHVDLVDEVIKNLNCIPFDFDVFVTTSDKEKKKIIEKAFASKLHAHYWKVDVVKNRGRDVKPFLDQMKKVAKNYKYVCHIHTKKSTFATYGNSWRKYLYNNLFGNEYNVSNIIETFEKNEKIGVLYPEIFKTIKSQTNDLNANYRPCKKLCKVLGIPVQYLNTKLVFPAGTMFWARTDAISPLFSDKIKQRYFEKEAGQINATFAHGVERIICYLAMSRGYKCQTFINKIDK